jgi:plasmid stabilization system protein ParE
LARGPQSWQGEAGAAQVTDIEWSPRAARAMFGLYEYLAGVSTEERALQAVDRIYAAVDLLKENPRMGRASEVQSRRELVIDDYVLTYQVKRGAIRVLRVERGRQRK